MSSSVLVTIATDVEKFFKGTETDLEKFGNAFEKVFKKAPSALQTVENFVNETAPLLEGAVALADPVAEPEVAAALSVAETGLAAIQAAAADANSGQSLAQNIQNFASDVPNILGAIQVKNPALKAAVERIATFIAGEAKVLIPAVQSWVAQIKSAQPPAPATT